MNKEIERKYESTFIPCEDALEKMDEIGIFTSSYEKENQNEENPGVSG